MAGEQESIDKVIAEWMPTGGSKLANKQSFLNGLRSLIDVDLAAIGEVRKLADGKFAA